MGLEDTHDGPTEAGRAQSDAVSTILLIGVVTLTMSMIGVGILDSQQAATEDPQANVDGRLIGSNLTLVHRGGEALNESELRVRIANNSSTSVTDFESGEIITGEDDGRFERGEQWQNTSTVPNDMRLDVWVIHDPTNSLIYDGTLYREP